MLTGLSGLSGLSAITRSSGVIIIGAPGIGNPIGLLLALTYPNSTGQSLGLLLTLTHS